MIAVDIYEKEPRMFDVFTRWFIRYRTEQVIKKKKCPLRKLRKASFTDVNRYFMKKTIKKIKQNLWPLDCEVSIDERERSIYVSYSSGTVKIKSRQIPELR